MTVIVKEKVTFVDFMCTDVSSLFSTFSNVHANKGNSILFSYFHSKVQILVARVQFVEKNIGFVEVWHDCEGIIHVPYIEGGELFSLF